MAYSTGVIVSCDVWAGTLYEAFKRFCAVNGDDTMTEIHIAEVMDDEGEEEKGPCAALP